MKKKHKITPSTLRETCNQLRSIETMLVVNHVIEKTVDAKTASKMIHEITHGLFEFLEDKMKMGE